MATETKIRVMLTEAEADMVEKALTAAGAAEPLPDRFEVLRDKVRAARQSPQVRGINPVTFRAPMGNVTMSRLWVSPDAGGTIQKNFSVVVWKPDASGDRPEGEPSLVNLDEDEFLRGLQHLFPAGEVKNIG